MKNIYIWGAGHFGVLTALELENNGEEIKGFIDKNASQIKKRLGLPVFELNEILPDKNQEFQIVIAIQDNDAIMEITKILLQAGLKKNIDFRVSPLIPIPVECFDSEEKAIEYYRNTIKYRDIYLHNETTAKRMADNWNGIVPKPQNLRFIENAIPVVLCANDKFAPYCAVMLQSLLVNSNPKRKYHFIIFERGFTQKIKNALLNQAEQFRHCAIDFVDISSILNEIPIAILQGTHHSIDMYSRLLIPYWFEKYEKIIYLDCDMLSKTDIAELYDIDISPFCLGAVLNRTSWHLKRKDYLKLTSPVFLLLKNWHGYFASGVLIFDTEKFRKKFSCQELFRFAIYYTNRYKKRYNDQDVLNLLVEDNYFVLPPEWNYMPAVNIPSIPKTKIVHFAGSIKPWDNNSPFENCIDTQEYKKFALNVPLFKGDF